MTMQELENKTLKLSAGTITVKNENGKTCGMVRGLKQFNRWSNSEQFENFQKIRQAGIWGSNVRGLLEYLYLDGKNLYYLNNLNRISHYEKYKKFLEENEKKHYQELKEIVEKSKNIGITVINCYIL